MGIIHNCSEKSLFVGLLNLNYHKILNKEFKKV